MSQDAVWLDVLPSMQKFGPALAKGAGDAADKAGTSAGKKFGAALAKGVVGVGGAAVVAGGALYKLGSTFDDVADTIRVGTGATGKDLDALVASAKLVGTQVPASFEDIGTTVADLNTRLGLTGPALEKVSSQFLELGRITGEAVNVKDTTAALSAFGVKGDAVAGAMDKLYQVSQASGVSINELSKRLGTNGAVVKQLGLDFNQAAVLVGSLDKAGVNSTAVMASMAKSMASLAKEGEAPQAAFKRVTGEVEALLAKGKDADAINLAGKVFGTRGAPQLISALKSGAISFQDLNKMAGQTSDTIMGAGTDTADFAEQWALFKNRLSVEVAPAAEKVFSLIGEGMTWVNDVAVPAVKAFAAEWQAGTGTAGEYRRTFEGVVDKLKMGLDFIVRNREALKTLTVGVVGGYLAWRVMTATLTAYQAVANVVRGSIVALTMAKRALTIAANSNAVAWVKDTAAMVAQKAASLAMAAASKVVAAGQWLVNAAMSANPIGLVIAALAALVGGLIYAYRHSETFRRIVNAAWDGIKRGAQAAWNWLKPNVIQPLWGFFGTTLPNAFRTFVRVHKEAWDGIKSKASAVWNWVRDKVIQPQVNFFTTTLPNAVRDFGRAFGKVWDGIKAAAAKPVNFVIGTVYNNGLRKALNLLPGVNLAEAPTLKGFRTGGYTGNAPAHHAAGVVHGREYVLTAQETAGMGGPRGVEAWKALAMRRGYQAGGYVWPTNSKALSGNYSGHSGVDVAVPTGSPLYAVASGTVSYVGAGRGYGNAIFMTDANGVPWVYGHGSRALVSPGQAVSKGQLLGYSGYSGNVRPAGPAGAHLHIEAARGAFANVANRAYTLGLLGGTTVPSGGGGGSGIVDLLTKFPKLLDGVRNGLSGMSGPWGDMLRPGIRGVVDGVKKWGLDKLKGLGDAVASTVTNLATGPNVLLGRAMAAARGWNGAEWSALNRLWEGESNWNHFAKNPSSGAYGIPQALPGNKMRSAGWDWKVNPATQIKWGMGYIAERYGSPSNAYRQWQARSPHWYANGTGNAQPGLAMVGELGLPELVVGPQPRMMQGGEKVYSSAQTRRLLGAGGSMRLVEGRLSIDEDGTAWVRGIAEDVVDDRDDAARRLNSVGVRRYA